MELKFIPVILFLLLTKKSAAHQQFISVLPSSGFGVGQTQTILSTNPYTGQQQFLQILRQPSLGSGLTQVVGVGNHGNVAQLLGGQQVLVNGGVGGGLAGTEGVPLVSGINGVGGQQVLTQVPLVNGAVGVGALGTEGIQLVNGVNGLGIASAGTLPYPYNSGVGSVISGANGVPVIVQGSSGLSLLNNGLQTITTVPATSVVQQPLVSMGPVLRQVGEEEGTVAAAVELDPMDAALLDMENKGQMHMEKYAWGRSALAEKEKAESDNETRERKASLPVYYAPLPVRGVVPVPTAGNSRLVPSPSGPRNPFVGDGGKRKKHFEHYEYFRNLDLRPQQVYVPMAVVPPSPSSPASSPSA